MRLESAIPLLIKWLKSSYDEAADECGTALGLIGTEDVLDAVWKTWPRASEQERIRVDVRTASDSLRTVL
jgi:hypothetical protein